ncbi:hypothetical protein L9F63_023117, partial [Diploptera punctata]
LPFLKLTTEIGWACETFSSCSKPYFEIHLTEPPEDEKQYFEARMGRPLLAGIHSFVNFVLIREQIFHKLILLLCIKNSKLIINFLNRLYIIMNSYEKGLFQALLICSNQAQNVQHLGGRNDDVITIWHPYDLVNGYEKKNKESIQHPLQTLHTDEIDDTYTVQEMDDIDFELCTRFDKSVQQSACAWFIQDPLLVTLCSFRRKTTEVISRLHELFTKREIIIY